MQIARRLWIAAVCAFAVLASATAAHAQQTNLLPNDTELVVIVNIQQILKSDVAKANKALVELAKGKIAEQLDEKGVDKWLKKADFDIFRDLTSMTLAMPGGRDKADEGVIILEGKFDAAKIKDAALEAGKEDKGTIKLIKIAGVEAFEVSPKEDKTMYVGVLNKKTMIACSTKKDFEEAVARVKGTKKAEFKSEVVKSLIKTMNEKQSISLVATSEILSKLSENNPQAGNPQAKAAIDGLKKYDGFSAAITAQKDVDFQVGINAKDNKTAKDTENLANAGLGIAKAKLKELAETNAQVAPFVDVVNSIRANTEGNTLLIRGQISYEVIEKLLQNLPMP